MKVEIELLRALMQIGFLAGDIGQFSEAETIFKCLSKYNPNSPYPYIGMANIAMNKGKFERAIAILSTAPFQDNKEDELRSSFLGKALKLAGYNEEAQRILKDIKINGTYDIAINMACELLETDFSVLIKQLNIPLLI